MLIVADDRAGLEADLAAGRLVCPRCGLGVLGGWGCARSARFADRGRAAVAAAQAGTLPGRRVPVDACAVAGCVFAAAS